MVAPRIPRDWTAPLRLQGYEATDLHVHEADGATECPPPAASMACPPCNGNCDQGRTCPAGRDEAANQSLFHCRHTHPAEWAMLAICAGVIVGPVAYAAALRWGWL